MQAALLVRNKRTKKRKDSKTLSLASLPPHVATKPINPFPRYNPVQVSLSFSPPKPYDCPFKALNEAFSFPPSTNRNALPGRLASGGPTQTPKNTRDRQVDPQVVERSQVAWFPRCSLAGDAEP